ncbi:hypothetical protein BM221_008169 [Beauveria bassiana]|uniref:Uncharacterized protein n=1 Tax=Beauveria bassiana TaxID=176275 RepID=A0A2N6NFC2_BEABA|nr:hypothetical protein BM221_008169 [Beauveria bassiana]
MTKCISARQWLEAPSIAWMDEKRYLPATARIASVNKFTVDDAFVGGTNVTVELSGHAAH